MQGSTNAGVKNTELWRRTELGVARGHSPLGRGGGKKVRPSAGPIRRDFTRILTQGDTGLLSGKDNNEHSGRGCLSTANNGGSQHYI